MKTFRLGMAGAVLLALTLVGYLVYELALFPAAGFPTSDFAVIVAGADTLRVGHWLKFGYALGLALLLVGLHPRVRASAPALAGLSAVAGAAAVTLFLASGQLGLRILLVAEQTYAAKPAEATATILLRTVTIALFQAAIFAAGWYTLLLNLAGARAGFLPRPLALAGLLLGGLFVADAALPPALALVSPVLTIGWAVGMVVALAHEPADRAGLALASDQTA